MGAQLRALPYARSRSKGARLPHPHREPGPPASALPGYTPFSPARLTPARAWRRHGHFALANRRGGRKQRGKGRKGGRVAPDVTGVADEQRPPLRRPPRPCLSLRFGSRSGGRPQVVRAEMPRAPASASLAVPRSPRGAAQAGMRPGRLRREPGAAAGTAATPAQAGPETLGPVRATGGGGDGDEEAGGRGRCTGQPIRSAPGLAPTESRAPGVVVKPRGHSLARMASGAGRVFPNPSLSHTCLGKLYSRPTRRA